MHSLIPVVIAGGSGTRLWPLSRSAYPKQFLHLGGQESLFQGTMTRLAGLTCDRPIIIGNEAHRFLMAEQLRADHHDADILLEPVGRNTAPAIALAALHALQRGAGDEPPVLLVMPADHVIADVAAFQKAVEHLLPLVREQGHFGTLGITPTHAATGYGYIQAETASDAAVASVHRFVEKPDEDTARQYLDSGGYYWNSGIFLMRADRYLDTLTQFRPDIAAPCRRAHDAIQTDHDFIRVNAEAFAASADESIDYAVMEPLAGQAESHVVMAPLDAGWNDVGSWSAIWELAGKDADSGNAVISTGDAVSPDVVMQDSRDCLVGANKRLVATLGVSDLVIVDTADALLVAHRDHVQDVKAVVTQLRDRGRSESETHREVYRPWGKYDSIDTGYRYQVKRITVDPGASLSVQKHHHRSEHWVVVSGTARVTNGDDVFLVTENQSTYIPVGQVHCLENPGVIPLEMIEVQSGAYLGEDDIIRLKDKYGRG